ncbi:MAG: carboxypeptidase-like regulatory domain-containing protein [Thermoplasmata archaeon]
MSASNTTNNPQPPQVAPPQYPQIVYGYNYYYPYAYQYYPYSYYYPQYTSPKYYYEITRYSTPFAPPRRQQNPKWLLVVSILLLVIAAVNFIAGGILLYAAYDEHYEHSAILKGSISDTNTTSPIENVKITVSGSGLTLFSDQNGTFEIPLPTGVHSLIFEKEGYQTINGTVVVGKYLDNTLNLEMEQGNGTLNQTLTSFQTVDDYIANLMVSSTLSVFVGGFALISAIYIRKARYRSLGIVSGVLSIFSLLILSGISLIFMLPALISAIIGFIVLIIMYFSSEIFLSQPITTAGTN